MPRFAFHARDRSGRAQSGVMEQATFEAVVDSLRRRQWLVLDVQPEQDAAPKSGGWANLDIGRYLSVRTSDIELSLRQLAVMLRSGLTLLDALRMLTEHTHRSSMRHVWRQVSEKILLGESLGNAMEAHRCFPRLVVQLTRVGEQTGELDVVLMRAAATLEQWRKLRSQVLTAMAYPVVVLFAAIGVAAFMVFSVIPKVQRFLQGMGKKLPAITQALVDVTDFIHRNLWYGVGILVVITIAVTAVRMWPKGRLITDRWLLLVPVFGGAFRTAGTAAFARNLSTLLQSGVPLLDGLLSIEQLLGNRYLSRVVNTTRDSILQGRTLADSLAKERAFAAMLPHMAAIGESAGRLDDVMAEAAHYYEDELQRTVSKLAALAEPVMLLVVGGIVGFVYIAFFMALFAAARG